MRRVANAAVVLDALYSKLTVCSARLICLVDSCRDHLGASAPEPMRHSRSSPDTRLFQVWCRSIARRCQGFEPCKRRQTRLLLTCKSDFQAVNILVVSRLHRQDTQEKLSVSLAFDDTATDAPLQCCLFTTWLRVFILSHGGIC